MTREIDENLKRVYREALDEEVPDRFRALLDALKAQDKGSRDTGGKGSA